MRFCYLIIKYQCVLDNKLRMHVMRKMERCLHNTDRRTKMFERKPKRSQTEQKKTEKNITLEYITFRF